MFNNEYVKPSNNEFDKTEIYKKEIEPLVKKIKSVCTRNDIPMFFTAMTENSDESSSYVSDIVSPAAHNIRVKDDYFPQLILAVMGYKSELHVLPQIKKANQDPESLT